MVLALIPDYYQGVPWICWSFFTGISYKEIRNSSKKWPIYLGYSLKSVASNVNDFNVEVHLFPLLAGLGQRSSVLCMLVLPNSQSTSFNWFSKVDNKRKELTVLWYILWMQEWSVYQVQTIPNLRPESLLASITTFAQIQNGMIQN